MIHLPIFIIGVKSMDANVQDKSVREGMAINCSSCDKRHHYRYTREELIDRFYKPDGPKIKACITDHAMDVIWLNYKLEDEIYMAPRDGLEPPTH